MVSRINFFLFYRYMASGRTRNSGETRLTQS
jgi:hypothetical protein